MAALASNVGFVLGLALVAMALLTYPSERGVIRSRLEGWWMSVGMTGERATAAHTRAFLSAARLLLVAIDWLVGPRLISARAIVTALFLSAASFAFTFAFIAAVLFLWLRFSSSEAAAIIGATVSIYHPEVITQLTVVGCAYVGLAVLPAFFRRPLLHRMNAVAIIIAYASLVALQLEGSIITECCGDDLPCSLYELLKCNALGQLQALTVASPGLLVGAATDLVVIAVTRWALRRCIGQDRPIAAIAVCLVMSAIAVVLAIGPFYGAVRVSGMAHMDRAYALTLAILALLAAPMNALDIAFVAAIAIMVAVWLLHRALWPIMQRPIYVLYELIPSRLAVAGVGTLLLTISNSTCRDWVKVLVVTLIPK